jgi:hypothetical protein
MRDIGPTDLAALALLYAGGELEGSEAAAFEDRLAQDQSAREALCQAVQLTQTLAGQAPLTPSASYRARVRRRLGSSSGSWGWLVGHRWYRGHPALWSGLGALATVLLMFLLGRWPPHAAAQAEPPSSIEQVALDGPQEPPPSVSPVTSEMAKVWADLHNADHLARARLEENRRRVRAEERGPRLPSPSTLKP